MDASHEDLVAQFSAVTGANPSIAQSILQSAEWDLSNAVQLFYAQQEGQGNEPFDDDEPEDPIAPAPSQSSAAQQAAAPSSANPSSRRLPGGGPRAVTLRDLQRGGDEEDDEDDDKQDMFAGGEKSALAVQNPGDGPVDHFRNIMNQARQNRERPRGEQDDSGDEPARPTHFSGRAQTLGGDEAPSRVVEDPSAAAQPQRQPPARVTRTLHLWADGVSIDDGPLFRFDDPANESIMTEINQGRAPKALLNVQLNQEVDLNLEPHKNEHYVAPKKKYQPFGGQGQRLGAPTPAVASFSSSSTVTAAPASSGTAPTSSPATQEMDLDESQPTIQLQIRLGDGTRLVSRFNTTHTIGDVYSFVERAAPASQQRAYALMTTFPSKELSDKAQVLGEMSDFKRGGVVVQKWK